MTKKQIKAEIAALRAITPKLPRFNLFNENIHAKVAAQIEVLQNALEEHAIFDRSVDGDGPDDSNPELWPAHIRDAALDAMRWRDGDPDFEESPSAGWKKVSESQFAKNARILRK